ncbi:Polygalacturonase 1 beta-like protein 3 [Glycine soja]|uniref:Polygalacturonase 1 beta-like protein 3 n=1 Tax=Glycine soja TaxID=3848 RepID=A0A0B2R476_GLYSO|nr:Putative polygalacturonase non-catalytic subunit [Glycine soja]RZB51961.1 Polygalacturonase 1 beta-like protein 3 [Glycine soja]
MTYGNIAATSPATVRASPTIVRTPTSPMRASTLMAPMLAATLTFQSYRKNFVGSGNEFTGYGTNSNVATLGFTNYGKGDASPNNTFTNYDMEMNVPEVMFKSYTDGTHGGTKSFVNYRDQANVGDDSFQSYAKNTKEGTQVDFKNYGNSFNPGSNTFKGYAKGEEWDHKLKHVLHVSDNSSMDKIIMDSLGECERAPSMESKTKINHEVAIYHLDTTVWSPTHNAFVALVLGPGQIEMCHWIFENDTTWTIVD